ncbi:MAG: ImmA/IrrE family metallo-endopeptidase [Actinomycetia bacterium]|nr:ImmA/IrrE family metallo-endopeptidase [Actinomycetes bacterium]
MSLPLPSYRVPVSSSVLRWARETAGLSLEEASRRARVSADRLLVWEGGTPEGAQLGLWAEEDVVESPTVAQLRVLAKRYRRPVSVFLLSEPPAERLSATYARRLHGAEADSGSPDLRFAVREACERRELALSLVAQIGEQPREPKVVGVDPGDPERSGEAIREALAVGSQDIAKWARDGGTLRQWIDRIDATGVLINQFRGVGVGERRGFSIVETPLPLIAINQGDAGTARVFTLLHEYAHVQLAVNGFGLSDESWCNAAAAAALMPAAGFKGAASSFEGDWPQRSAQLAEAFGVSREAAYRRLVTFGLISQDDYRAARSWLTHEPKPEGGAGGGPGYPGNRVREIGRGFIQIVGAAYDGNAISLHEASRYLDVKAKDVDKLVSRAVGG